MDYGLSKGQFNSLINEAFLYVHPLYERNLPSHDFAHVKSVFGNVLRISFLEKLSPEVALISAIFHDVVQDKDSQGQDVERSADLAKEYLFGKGLSETFCVEVHETIIKSSWDFFEEKQQSLTDSCFLLRDADFLESIGATGIARAFSFSGENGITFGFLPSFHEHKTVNTHISDKLMKLKGLFYFEASKREAALRHNYMINFINEYKREVKWSEVEKRSFPI